MVNKNELRIHFRNTKYSIKKTGKNQVKNKLLWKVIIFFDYQFVMHSNEWLNQVEFSGVLIFPLPI